jgi:monoamine oxidase
MPVAFEGPPNEVIGLSMFPEEQRAALLRDLNGLTDEQAAGHPTSSSFCSSRRWSEGACTPTRTAATSAGAERRRVTNAGAR